MEQPLPAAVAPLHVFELRGQHVILDADLARMFDIESKRLNEQVKRNPEKFEDFAFQLTMEEFESLRSHNATSNAGRGGRRYRPYAFTQHGVVMAATVVKSEQAIAASRFIIKVFVEARRRTPDGSNLPDPLDARRLTPLETETRTSLVGKLNTALGRVLDAIADPVARTTIRDEARALAAEGLASLKDYLRKAGVQNEKTLAEVRKLLAEAEAVEAETALRATENQHRQLALLAKQLRLVLVAQQYLERGSVENLLTVLKDLERA